MTPALKMDLVPKEAIEATRNYSKGPKLTEPSTFSLT